MKLLIIGDKKRFLHLEKFASELQKSNIEIKIIYDLEFIDRFFEFNLQKKMNKKKKFDDVLRIFKPDLVLLDRITKIGKKIIEKDIPYYILLRGNYWEEVSWAKNTIYRSKIEKMRVKENEKNFDHCMKNAKMILPISKYLEEVTKEKYPDKKIKILAADGRVPNEWKNFGDSKLKHPNVGLLQGLNIWGKSRELLTLKKVLREIPDVTFYFAGDGIYRDKILPDLQEFENFVWLRELENPEKVKEYLTEVDIFLFLTGLEGLGQSIIEAALMKKPIIASDTGGVRDLINNDVNGFLINQGEHEKIVKLIKNFINNPDLSNDMGERAYNSVKQKFDWKNIAKEFVEIIQEDGFLKN